MSLHHPRPEHLTYQPGGWEALLNAAVEELECGRTEETNANPHHRRRRPATGHTIADPERASTENHEAPMTREERALATVAAMEDAEAAGLPSNPTALRLNAEVGRLLAQDTLLARDVAYFGEDKLAQILEGYRLTEAELLDKLRDERFREMVRKFRADIDKDLHGLVRARAATYLDAELDRVHEIAMHAEKAGDSLKAVSFMASLADAMPKETKIGDGGTGGVAIAINIGESHPLQRKFQEIVVDARESEA